MYSYCDVLYLPTQSITSVSAEFEEGSDPVMIAAEITLTDYDSPDSSGTEVTVTLTLTEAIDGESEGVNVVTSGGVIVNVSIEEHTQVYTISNGTSYSQYQEVCLCHLVPYVS